MFVGPDGVGEAGGARKLWWYLFAVQELALELGLLLEGLAASLKLKKLAHRTDFEYSIVWEKLEKFESERDLGEIVKPDLSPVVTEEACWWRLHGVSELAGVLVA